MRNPLLPVIALVALVILVCEGFFGGFTKLCDPSRSLSHYSHYVANENWMRVQIDEIPSERKKTVRVVCNVLEITDSNGIYHTCNGKIQLYFQKPSDISFGDELLVLSSPYFPSAVENPHQFDYRRYLQRKGILYLGFIPTSNYKILTHTTKGWKYRITIFRQRLIDVIRFSQLTPSQQGIAEALILGYDEDLNPETKVNFQTAGITHLLCVSGLHVGIVAMIVGWCLFFLSNRRPTRIIKGCIQLLAIWAFAILTGMAPATMRAALMFSLIVIGQMFFTRPPTLNIIAASALILLIAKPLLLFDVGFQLSYCSVLGIIFLVRPLEELMPFPDKGNIIVSLLKKLRTLFCISFVAQLAITPFILYYFHYFPPYFLIANIIIIPFAGIILASVLTMLLFSFWNWAFVILGKMVSFELSITELITSTIASWPNAMIEHIYFDRTMLFISIIIVVFLGWTIIRRQWSKLAITLVFALILAIYAKHIEKQCSVQQHFDVYNVDNHTAIEFFSGHESYLVCDSNIARDPNSIDYQTENNIIHRQTKQRHILSLDTTFEDNNIFISNRFIGFNKRTMRIIDRSNYRERSKTHPKVDYLILRKSPYITIFELQEQYTFDTLIITSQNSTRRRTAWQQECDSLRIPYKE